MTRVVLSWREGGEETVHVSAGETILDAAEDAGIHLPFGCRTGACATCTGRLREGAVDHRREPRGLKSRHLDAGYVLCCIAEPRDDCRIDVGSAVARELVSNPWK